MKLFFYLFLVSFAFLAQAQTELAIIGKVVDAESKEPVEFATVAVKKTGDNSPITGVTTGMDGSFLIKTDASDFYIEVSFIGFEKLEISSFNSSEERIDLGVINLGVDSKQLEEIVIEGEKSSTEFRIDKRVFNVGADLSSAGASALDVLGNVPSVNVNIEGQVSLRGSSGVQILIDGKPSVLTSSDNGNALGTITADMIESVEVITNPSAKYEAEGTSGIINIILKKEEKRGTNGSISLNTGVPHNHSLGFSLNHRTEKFNLFTQIGAGYRELPDKRRSKNTNLVTDTTISTVGKEYRNEQFYNFILGSDYYINQYNVLTLSGNFALEIEDQPSTTNYIMENANGVISEWIRNEATEATNPKYQFEMQYKRDFQDDEDHDLLFSAIGSFFGKTQSSDFITETTAGASFQDAQQKTATAFDEGKYTFKLDYTRPFSESFTLETGTQYLINDVGNDYSVSNLQDGIWVLDESQTNNFEYMQNVLGIYATGAYELDKWGVKVGMRVENTDLETVLTTTDERNSQNYNNLFPSAHASYKLTETFSLQSGYSRRIFRPRLWDLNPFFNLRDNFNIRRGNPDLQPEFTDSYEIAAVFNGNNISLSSSVYHRYTTGVVERISFYQDNVNVTQPENIGSNNATGLEVNAKLEAVRWVTINTDFNYNYYDRRGELEGSTIDFQANQWSSKVNSKFKFPADIDVEVTGTYRSQYETVQGEQGDQLFMDLGARKKIINGKGVINFSVRDVFASRIERNFVYQPTYELYSRSLRGTFVTLGFSYGFGKGEAMTYSGGRR
jgi:outer membrane receptor protein involved in Fe transport